MYDLNRLSYSSEGDTLHCTWVIAALVLAVSLGTSGSVVSGYSSTNLPTVTSIYVFQPDSSSVYQSGGYALGPYVSETYPVEGTFQLRVNHAYGWASFVKVDAELTETSDVLESQSLGSLFDMIYLDGVVVGDSIIEFIGAWSGPDPEVIMTLYFSGDTVELDGETIPPSYDDYYYYDLTAVAVRKYGGGTGEHDNPYLIATAEHMNSIGIHPEDWGSHFKMVQDVDLGLYQATAFNTIGYCEGESGAQPFTGVFDGDGYSILNFSYSSAGADGIGLFRYVDGADAQIVNVVMVDPDVDAGNGQCVGALVGHLGSGAVVNCQVRGGRVAGAEVVGGLVGRNGLCRTGACEPENPCMAGRLTACQSTSNVVGLSSVGGLVGANDGAVADCSSASTVTGQRNIGGLAGTNGNSIANCDGVATVSGDMNVGGLVGSNMGVVCGSHAAGAVDAQENAGGLVGDNDGGSVTVCNAAGTVNGGFLVGGLVGTNGGNIHNSFSGGLATGDLYVGGLVGRNIWRVSGCYSTADAAAQYGYVGGLVGSNESAGSIADSYADGTVGGPLYVGGLLGDNDGIILRCYANGQVDGVDKAGGLVGGSTDQGCTLFSFWDIGTSGHAASAGGTGKTTSQMKAADTFENWGACRTEALWTLDNGQDYPRLLWEDRPGQVIPLVKLSELLAGSGTEDDPFLISTPQGLNAVGLFPWEWDKHFQLAADVDMSAQAATDFNAIGCYRLPFTGVFDGDGRAILGFTYSPAAGSAYAGLFGCVSSLRGHVHDLGLVDATITGEATDYVGALVGCLRDGAITNCYAENVDVVGHHFVGGLIGAGRGTAESCHVAGSVSGITDVGGLVGGNWDSVISNCHMDGAVTGVSRVGGLAGGNWDGAISGCHSSGLVTGTSQVGGLVGDNDGVIEGGYSDSAVSADDLGGGLVGRNLGHIEDASAAGQTIGNEKIGGLTGGNEGEIVGCYATGNVTGDASVGGLSGLNLDATITACYAAGVIYGRLSAGGLVGRNAGQYVLADCYALGSASGNEWIGGLAGRNEGAIAGCYAVGSASGTMDIGGLVGANLGAGSVRDCYAWGAASGYEWVGGLVGTNAGSISECYAVGGVAGVGQTVGGLVGFDYGAVSTSFWDVQTSGRTTSAGGTGKTTSQMQMRSTFTSVGWDFVGETANGTDDMWQILEGQGYPTLSWETAGGL